MGTSTLRKGTVVKTGALSKLCASETVTARVRLDEVILGSTLALATLH